MLILSRKALETVMIGDDIQISILGINGTSVRIGIKAPRKIPIYRTELYIRLKQMLNKQQNNLKQIITY